MENEPKSCVEGDPSTPRKDRQSPSELGSARPSLPGLFAVGWWPTCVSWVLNPPLPWLPAWLLATVRPQLCLKASGVISVRRTLERFGLGRTLKTIWFQPPAVGRATCHQSRWLRALSNLP